MLSTKKFQFNKHAKTNEVLNVDWVLLRTTIQLYRVNFLASKLLTVKSKVLIITISFFFLLHVFAWSERELSAIYENRIVCIRKHSGPSEYNGSFTLQETDSESDLSPCL